MSRQIPRRQAIGLLAATLTLPSVVVAAPPRPRPLVLLHDGNVAAAPWTGDFAVVPWDAGNRLETASLDQLCRNAYGTVIDTCRRLRARQVVMVGHARGAPVALEFVRRWPHLVSTLVSTGSSVAGRRHRQIEVPVLIVHGRDEPLAARRRSRQWFDEVRAPKKGYHTIAGDDRACFTNPTEFLDKLRGFV